MVTMVIIQGRNARSVSQAGNPGRRPLVGPVSPTDRHDRHHRHQSDLRGFGVTGHAVLNVSFLKRKQARMRPQRRFQETGPTEHCGLVLRHFCLNTRPTCPFGR